MEETWELAALSDVDKAEWSSRHVRLRYQSALSAVMFWMFCSFEMTQFSIFGAVKFSEFPDQKYIIFVSGLFSIFSFLSLIGRTYYENNFRYDEFRDAGKIRVYLDGYITRLMDIFNDNRLANWMSRFSDSNVMIVDGLEGLKDEEVLKDTIEIKYPSKVLGENQNKIEVSAEVFLRYLNVSVEYAEKIEKILKSSMLAQKTTASGELSPISMIISDVELMRISSEKMAESAHSAELALAEGQDKSDALLKFRASLDQFNRARANLFSDVKSMRKSMARYRWSSFFENNLASIYVPIAVWVFLFFSGLYQLTYTTVGIDKTDKYDKICEFCNEF